jgi:biotin synthase
MGSTEVLEAARAAKASGATRFCMGAAWRSPRPKDLEATVELVKAVKSLGLETCATLGMLRADQALALKEAGLDYYNHNLDTSRGFYPKVIRTRGFEERLETLENVRRAGMRVCCGGIIGMGEAVEDRCELLVTLACLPKHPESVPINVLVRVSGTPLEDAEPADPFDLVRTIALARILMPASYVRLSAGRTGMSDEIQALCFLAGANSVFYGEKLLTTANPEIDRDRRLFARLGMTIES